MTAAARDRAAFRLPVLAVVASAWIALAARSARADGVGHCVTFAPDGASLTKTFGSLALDWVLMVVAMMGMAIVPAIHHVAMRSFARRRGGTIAFFVLGYVGVWLLAGAAFLPALAAIRSFAPGPCAPAFFGLLVAGVWQCSPSKQRCLNRAHAHPALPAFGLAAYAGAFRFGVAHAVPCVGACGGVMLAAELLPLNGVAAMALATLWLAAERRNRPEPPRWRMRGIGRVLRRYAANPWSPWRRARGAHV